MDFAPFTFFPLILITISPTFISAFFAGEKTPSFVTMSLSPMTVAPSVLMVSPADIPPRYNSVSAFAVIPFPFINNISASVRIKANNTFIFL